MDSPEHSAGFMGASVPTNTRAVKPPGVEIPLSKAVETTPNATPNPAPWARVPAPAPAHCCLLGLNTGFGARQTCGYNSQLNHLLAV